MRFFSLLLAMAMISSLSARQFTNKSGKAIDAEIVRANASSVTLRLSTKRTATIKINTLSQEDQDHVISWLADQVPRLRITPNMVRSSKKSGSSYYPSYTQTMDLSVVFQNEDNAKGLEETTLKYFLIGRSVNDRSKNKILLVQEVDFEVGAGGAHTVHFRKAVNNYYGSKSNTFSSYSGDYKCYGHVLFATRKKDGREVYSHGSTTHLTEGIYSIVGLKTGDIVDENYQKPTAREIGIGGKNDPTGTPQRRPGQPSPLRKPEDAPIIIR
jgi:hypothetical protein